MTAPTAAKDNPVTNFIPEVLSALQPFSKTVYLSLHLVHVALSEQVKQFLSSHTIFTHFFATGVVSYPASHVLHSSVIISAYGSLVAHPTVLVSQVPIVKSVGVADTFAHLPAPQT